MAEETQETVQKEEKGGSKKFIIYSSVIFVQLVAAIVLVKFLLLPMFFEGNADAAEVDEKPEGEATEQLVMGETYKIDGLTVNPKDSMGRRFGVFEIVLEISNGEYKEALKKYEPLLRDKLITYFSTKTVAQLSSEAVRELSKSDIQKLVNETLEQEVVTNVYFTRYILQ